MLHGNGAFSFICEWVGNFSFAYDTTDPCWTFIHKNLGWYHSLCVPNEASVASQNSSSHNDHIESDLKKIPFRKYENCPLLPKISYTRLGAVKIGGYYGGRVWVGAEGRGSFVFRKPIQKCGSCKWSRIGKNWIIIR